jgi:alanyl-tRNA synthetase
MTSKLFWHNPYQTECTATVTSIEERKVRVDQTIFYAFSGGQQSDEGTIGGVKVISAVKEGDKENIIEIEYELESEPDFNVGDEVEIQIDGKIRSNLMKLHSAAHIVYYVINEQLRNVKIIGSNVAHNKARIDIATETPLTDILSELEKSTNEFISKGHEIERHQDENNPDLWWWQLNEWKMLCGGTHVKNTIEIGTLKFARKNKGKGKERIEIYLSS